MKRRKINPQKKLTINDSVIFEGDALTVLRRLPSETVKCVVTSPPYWSLRDYKIEGQIGLEETVSNFINNLVSIFSEIKRVLKSDGTLWVNIGDAYTSGNRGWRAVDKKNPSRVMNKRPNTPKGLKRKDLIGIPWRLAFALQNDGWYLRSDIIWHKTNAMPESVKDRPTLAHEYIFLFSKSEKYYYDHKAAKEKMGNKERNRRSVWAINTQPSPTKHIAAFPPTLIEPCILAGTKKGELILDPFFGSGTVGIVCEKHERKFIGIELNPEYIKMAIKNMKDIRKKVKKQKVLWPEF